MDKREASRGYDYDTLNRLITSRQKDTQDWSSPTWSTTSYQYDDLGNRISSNDRGAGGIAYAHDKANRMTTVAGLTQRYDNAGNVTVATAATGVCRTGTTSPKVARETTTR